MEHKIINGLIKKSNAALESAEFNYKNEYYETCQNRLYYAIFYIVSALAYKNNFVTSKHSQLVGWFNKKYIYEDKIFDSKMLAIYKDAFESRQKSDYDITYLPDKNEIFVFITDVKYFIDEIKKYLEINAN